MNATVQFLWDRHCQRLPNVADWAIAMLEAGHESDSILRLTDRDLDWEDRDRLLRTALRDLAQQELLEPLRLRQAYERERIREYLTGRLDAWALILEGCCNWGDEAAWDGEDRLFWVRLSYDAHELQGRERDALVSQEIAKRFGAVA